MERLDMFFSCFASPVPRRVPLFLNRLMGLPLAMQGEVMQRLELAFSGLLERMAAEGRQVSSGIRLVEGVPRAEAAWPVVVLGGDRPISSAQEHAEAEAVGVLLHKLRYDVSVSFEQAVARSRRVAAGAPRGHGFGSDFWLERTPKDGVPPRPLLVKGAGYSAKASCKLASVLFPNGVAAYPTEHDLNERYRICDAADAELADAWRAELADEGRMTRGLRTVHLLTGRLVPHWLQIFDRLQEHYKTDTPSLQIIQAPIAPGSSLGDHTHLVGLQVPTTMKFNDDV
jgi:hypothetical protein